jgi:hypothetical protein
MRATRAPASWSKIVTNTSNLLLLLPWPSPQSVKKESKLSWRFLRSRYWTVNDRTSFVDVMQASNLGIANLLWKAVLKGSSDRIQHASSNIVYTMCLNSIAKRSKCLSNEATSSPYDGYLHNAPTSYWKSSCLRPKLAITPLSRAIWISTFGATFAISVTFLFTSILFSISEDLCSTVFLLRRAAPSI